MDEFNINPLTYPEPDQFNVDTGTLVPPVSAEVASQRATRAQFGSSNIIGLPLEEIKRNIQSGNEGALRQNAAAQLDARKVRDKQERIVKIATNPYADKSEIFRLANTPDPPTDSNSVFEDMFAINYTNKIYSVNGTDPEKPRFSWLQDALTIIPKESQFYYDASTEAVAKFMLSRQHEENSEEATKNQPYFNKPLGEANLLESLMSGGWLPDQLKRLTQLYPNYKFSNINLKGMPTGPEAGVLTNTILENVRLALFALPYPEYKVEYKKIMDKLTQDNPSLAHEFAKAMTGLTDNEKFFNTVFDLTVPFDVTLGAKFGVKSVQLANQVRTSAKSIIHSTSMVPEIGPEAAAAAGVGDLATSAVKRATTINLEHLSGTPNETKRAVEALTSNFRLDAEGVGVGANPARGGQELVNRIQQNFNTGMNSLMEGLLTWGRVNRTPVAVSSDGVNRQIIEDLKGKFKGMDNAILDVKGPLVEPISNSHIYEFKLGTSDGEYFKGRQDAVNTARANGIIIRPTVAEKIQEINAKIGELNNMLKPEGPMEVAYPKVKGAKTKIENEDFLPTPANVNVPKTIPELEKEIAQLTERRAMFERNRKIAQENKAAAKTEEGIASQKELDRTWKERSAFVNRQMKALKQEIKDNQIKEEIGKRVTDLRAERSEFAKTPAAERGTTNVPLSEGFEVMQDKAGAGWYINVTKYLPETADVTRDNLITTAYERIGAYRKALLGSEVSTSAPPQRFYSWLFGKARTPEETLSKQERASRHVATATTNKVVELLKEEKSALNDLPFRYKKDFNRVLTYAQHKPDPITGINGTFEKNVGDLDALYQRYLKRPVSDAEAEAYFEFKKLIEFDRVFREMANFRNRARAGMESHTFSLKDSQNKQVWAPFFDGARLNHVPGGSDVVMVVGRKMGEENFYRADAIPPQIRKELVAEVTDGSRKAFKLWNPDDFPFMDFVKSSMGKRVRYVISYDSKTQPLSWQSINRTGGGHLMPNYDRYIKQASMMREHVGPRVVDTYRGDTTLAPVLDLAESQKLIRDIEQVRTTWASQGEERAKEIFEQLKNDNKVIPWDWDTWHGWHFPGRDPSGKTTLPRFNIHYPYQVVAKDQLIADIDNSLELMGRHQFHDVERGIKYNSFVDGTRSGSDARLAAIEFTQSRDAYDMRVIKKEIGTDGNPVYSFQPVEYVDPITAMDRGLSRIVNTSINDDYKLYAMEHWLQNAHMHLNLGENGLEKLRASPQYYFHKGEYLDGTPIPIKWELENQRARIKQFLTTGLSDLDTAGYRASIKLSDTIYNKTGASKLSQVPIHLWPYIKDPVTLVRSWAFQLTQGFMNLNTFFTNMSTYGLIYGLSPRHAPSGALATILHDISYFNKSDETLDFLDKMASSFHRGPTNPLIVGWKPGWLKEGIKELDRSGFAIVGKENAFLSTDANINVMRGMTENATISSITNAWEKVKDVGLTPFKVANGAVKQAAYFTAFLEWRQANPLKVIDRFDREQIIQRADLLNINMSRASNSAAHTGWASIPMQFEAYSIRLSEMLYGKRLTPMEKMRMLAASTLYYGPKYGAIGLLGFFPFFGTAVDKAVQDKLGYIPGENPVSTGIMEGGLTALASYVTGGGDFKKGNLYDFSRWGNKGIETVDAMYSDKTMFDILFGASGSTLKNIRDFVGVPMYRALASMAIKDDPNGPKAWKLTSETIADAARVLATGNKIRQTILAVNTQTWSSKNEVPITDGVSAASAIFMGIAGVNPLDQRTSYTKSEWLKEQNKLYADAEKEYIKEYRRAIMVGSGKVKDEAAFDKHMTNANSFLEAVNYPDSMMKSLLHKANEGLETKTKQVEERFWTKNLPAGKEAAKLQQSERNQQMRRQRGQE